MGFESVNATSGNITGNTGSGTLNHYGPRKIDQTYGGEDMSDGLAKTLSYTIDLAEIITGAPSTSNVLVSGSTNTLNQSIPAYAKILSVKAEVVEALSTTGGSAATSATLTFGLEQSDGTDIDLDGLIDATDGALTIASNDIANARGTMFVGSNAALVPNVSIGSAAGELYGLLTIDDVTGMTAVAGKVRLVVEYLPEGA